MASLTKDKRITTIASYIAFVAIVISITFFFLSVFKPYMGVGLVFDEGSWTVGSVDEHGVAFTAGINVGDRVLLVNKQDTETSLKRYEKPGSLRFIEQIVVTNSNGDTTEADIHTASQSGKAYFELASWFLLSAVFWLVGLFIFKNKPGNVAALLLLLCGAALGLALSTTLAADRLIPGALHLGIIAGTMGPWLLLHFMIVLPEERASTRADKRVLLIYILPLVVLSLYPFIGYADGQPLPDFRVFRLLGYGVGFLGVIAVAVFNYFGARLPRTRQQMKIIMVGCLIALIPFTILSLFPAAMGGTIVTPSDFSILLLAFIPLSLGFAVLTQRLMDIDVVLRRGVVYGLITLAMAVVLTVAFALVLSDGIAPGISQQFLLALLLSGLAVFLLGPTKNLIETLVDRFIYKDRFDYRQTIQVLSSSLSATTDTTVASSLVVDSPVTSMNLAGACLFLASEAGSFELGAARGIFSSTASQRHLLELLLRRNISIEFPKLAETPDPDIAFIIPLVAAGKEVGVLFLSPKLSKQEFTGRDFYFIQGLASVASVSLRGLLIAEADIKTRRHHEKAILEAKQEWESTFDSIPDLICILDADHNVIRLNRAMADAIGQPPAALVGKKCYQLLHDTDGPLATCPLEASDCAAAANEITRCGSVYEITISPLINNSRTSGRYVHVARNVTAVKVAEAEQKRLKEKAEMSSRLAAVGEMAAGIAHEINNPLTGVLGFSELLLQEDLPPDTKEQLKIIADGSKRVAEIVRRMLTFARQTTPIKKHVDIHELIDTTIDLRSYVLRTSGIEVVKNYHADISGISVDPSQIQQVFLNLLINAEYAIKQSNSPGVITINTETDDTFLRVVLSDNGPGIPVEVMNKLFQPFFTTKDPGQGTGLGLSLSRAIIVEHGGRLDVESPPGQGARFTIELPLTRSEDVIIPTASIAVPAVSVSRTVDILVIDDEECVRGVIRGILSQPNRLLDAAASAVEALRLMKKKHYDVIIMDLRMPGTSGITLFDDILALQPGARFRTIVVTGDVLDSRVKAFITDNGLDSLVKPFEPAELAQAVEKVLRRIGVSVHNY